MIDPRWKKVTGDLVSNPTRTILVVLSIFIGVFAVGLITSSQAIITREMRSAYTEANPANATIGVSDEDSFGTDLLEVVRNVDGVGEAEGRRSFGAQARTSRNEWKDMSLVAIDDFDEISINQFTVLRGLSEPPDKTMLLERSALEELGVELGDNILVERPDGKQRVLQISGVVYAPTVFPAQFGGSTAYVSFDTMEWLSGERDFTQVLIVSAENRFDQEHNQVVAERVYDKLQKSGRNPSFPNATTPDDHPLDTFIGGMVAVLSLMGVMTVFLSGFLVTNTISGLLAQQVRQIGIMKSIGARGGQIIVMYLVLVVCFGLLALVLSYPAVQLATRAFTDLVAGLFNFDLASYAVPASVIGIQIFISVGVPVLAAIYPVFAGTRVTVREALSSEGGPNTYGQGWLDRIIQGIKGLPRPVLLSLRNTFRRKGRVALTLVTLTLGGAVFIGVFSVRNSLLQTFEDILSSLFNYDVQVAFERSYRADYVVNEAENIPGVVEAEAWQTAGVRRVLPDDSEGESITLWGVPYDSQMVQPTVIGGRWLLPKDENAIVLSNGVMEDDSDIEIGDEIVLTFQGRETTWQVVGEVATIGGARWAYTDYQSYGRAAREVGMAPNLQVQIEPDTPQDQQAVATALDEHFSRMGINVASTDTGAAIRERQGTFVNVIVFALLAMSVLIAVVGGLGLMGTMSLNVLERTREIGVMRAIGASDGRVLQVVMVEGIVLGVLSWMLGVLLSFPISRLLSDTVGIQLFSFPLSFSFSVDGAIIWLIIAVTLAALASFLPAWRASRVTVRDVLAYE